MPIHLRACFSWPLVSMFKKGFPQFSFVLSADPNSQIFCRFKWLFTQCLLHLQGRLLKEEKELKVVLMTSAKGSETQFRKLSIISKLLKEYAELAELQRNLLSLCSPDTTAFESLIRFVERHKNDLGEEDYDWIFRADDLMTLWPYAEDTMLEDVIQAFLVIIPQKLFPSFAVSD